ncbi:UDP-glycosyltransferase 74F2 [Elaeis guineensis]|uniref:Glycosyltransferase n=1 Tax=Elaeis guineensis var. tenera TaxID=51953 RepID=A0A6I9QHC3_ELAGV|nr:UDP-glycosyltransferase 74F2 [Elaeis guineensis]
MACKAHVLVLPYPRQGHINPMLQFAKLLSHRGLKTTLVLTVATTKSMHGELSSVGIETISDGYDDEHEKEKDTTEAILQRLRAVGSRTLAELIERMKGSGHPVSCIVYDAVLPWPLDVARELGVLGAAFLTQPCIVDAVYYHVYRGSLAVPLVGSTFRLTGLPEIGASDMPSFVSVPGYSPTHLKILVNQFSNMETADWVLCNTFQELENEVINWMANYMPMKAIGPMVPSTCINEHLDGDKNYGVDLWKANGGVCMNWLDKREPQSVVYVSFGSISKVGSEQMEELAWGLSKSSYYFLLVVRTVEEDKLPTKFMEETKEKGLVVPWCPQPEVLAHKAIGCFVTHCGWNSTLEAISLSVPMVAVPQWTDQPTNAKCVEDIWRVGVRARVDESGIVRRDEIEGCIKMVMEGEKAIEINGNARKWRELAVKALMEDGPSNKNINDFVARVATKKDLKTITLAS